MGDKLDGSQVRHVAGLARLRLTDEEVGLYAEQLSSILDYVEKLEKLDTSGVPPTAHPLDTRNVLREDVIGESWSPEQALANAPDKQDGFFRVPKVLDQEGT